MSVITISNEQLEVSISTHGAEIIGVCSKINHTEYMWCGDKKYWGRVSPILFPFVGKLAGQEFRYDGQTYSDIPQHGFARDSEFKIIEKGENCVVFELEELRWQDKYPFSFSLRIMYVIEENVVRVIWKVKNVGENDMYFSIGAHPAFACEGGLEEYELDFHTSKREIDCELLNEDGLLSDHQIEILKKGRLGLSDSLFDRDALIINSSEINNISLMKKNGNPIVNIEFEAPLVGVWSPAKKGAPFVCIEPWYGRCDRIGYNGSLQDREYTNRLEGGRVFEKEYRMKFYI